MTATLPVRRRSFRPSAPTDLRLTLAPLWHGRPDRTMTVSRSDMWRASRTPHGAGVVRVCVSSSDGGFVAEAWGPGGGWLLDRVPRLLGAIDPVEEFVARHPVVRQAQRRLPGLRIGRSDAVFEALLPAVLSQKVTGREAHRSLAALQRTFGEPAPVPDGGPPLLLPPAPAAVADAPSHVFHAAGVERKRSDALRRAATSAARLEACVDDTPAELTRRIRAIPGLGPWTAAEVCFVALGDVDAVSVGDYHTKHLVSWALAGEPRGTDERMLELLEPYRPQRGRVVRLLEAAGVSAPKYGPRLSIQARW